jgi:hypothetical protein
VRKDKWFYLQMSAVCCGNLGLCLKPCSPIVIVFLFMKTLDVTHSAKQL